MKAQMLQNESQEVERNLKAITEHVGDLIKFKENLDFLDMENSVNHVTKVNNSSDRDSAVKGNSISRMLCKNDEKEILASLGRGVYIKGKIEDNKKLFVEVGAGVVLKKTPFETRNIIEEQIRRFEEARMQLLGQLHLYKEEFGKMVKEINRVKKYSGE